MDELMKMFLAFQTLIFYRDEERFWKRFKRTEWFLVFFLTFTICIVLNAMEHCMLGGHDILFMVNALMLVVNCVNFCSVMDRLTDSIEKIRRFHEMWKEIEAEIYAMLPR